MDPTPYFTSIGCNRDGRCLKWDHGSNTIAYAGSNLIAVYNVDKSVNAIVATMKGHTKDISTVDFFPQSATQQYINKNNNKNGQVFDLLYTKVVSGCFGGQICIFDLYQSQVDTYQPDQLNTSIQPQHSNINTYPQHQGKFFYRLNSSFTIPNTSILHAKIININQFSILVVVTSTGGIYLYGQYITPLDSIENQSQWTLLQEIFVPVHQLIQTTSFTIYPHPTQNILLLALGGVDGTLTLLGSTIPFVWKNQSDMDHFISEIKPTTPLFTPLGSLKGHRDWIRDIAFSPPQYDQNTDGLTRILLATGSQDKTIRILSINIPPKAVLDATKRSNNDNDDNNNDDDNNKIGATLLQSSSLGENGHLWTLDSTTTIPNGPKETMYIAIALETVLFGHENWVMSLEFFEHDESNNFALTLLSVSTDRTIIEWIQQSYSNSSLGSNSTNKDESGSNSLWIPQQKIGEGLNYLCYYGGVYGPRAMSVVAVAYNGSLSLWDRYLDTKDVDTIPNQAIGSGGIIKPWYPVHCPTGHNKPVLDVIVCTGDDSVSANYMANVDKNNNINIGATGITSKQWNGPVLPYLLTLSQDQTTRAYAPFVINKVNNDNNNKEEIIKHPQIVAQSNTQSNTIKPTMVSYPWYELARAQIHGWDLCSLTHVNMIKFDKNNNTNNDQHIHHHEFFSAGEEKVLRLFRAPALFVAQLYAMTSDLSYKTEHYRDLIKLLVDQNSQNTQNNNNTEGSLKLASTITRPLCAIQPQLGLSNKPVLVGDEVATGTELEVSFNGDNGQTQLTIDMILNTLPTANTMVYNKNNNNNTKPQSLICPPYEEQLSTTTLWSEVDKLYGHGYDISTITTTYNANLQPYQDTINYSTFSHPQIFSANHARKQKSAGIRQWAITTDDLFGKDDDELGLGSGMEGNGGNAEYYEEQDILYAHQQTISTLTPTIDNYYLLSVGRDMQVTVYGSKVEQESFDNNDNDKNVSNGPDCDAIGPALPEMISKTAIDKIPFKPIAIQQAAHSRQIFNCTWLFDGISTTPPTPNTTDVPITVVPTTMKYFATCARDKTVKIWCFNPQLQTKQITLVQTIKVPQVPTALYSISVLDEMPITKDECANYFSSPDSKQQQCTNYIFVGYENGDIAILKSTLDVTLIKTNNNTANQGVVLPYSIVTTSTQPTISFASHYTFNNNITHNSTVNKITSFPQVVNHDNNDKNTINNQKSQYIFTKNQHVVLVTVSNDHSVKMFGVDL